MKITEEDFKDGVGREVEQVETVPGCLREEQCDPNPCENESERIPGKPHSIWWAFWRMQNI